MNVLIAGKTPSPLEPIIRGSGCNVIQCFEKVDLELLDKKADDFMVSYGYRFVISRSIVKFLHMKAINLHISFLPWNRGADPNLWSFLEDTPKGVSIHYIDEGLDTGDIIVQKEVVFDVDCETLATTYQKLSNEIVGLFSQNWLNIIHARISGKKQPAGGSFHRLADKRRFDYLLAKKGWNTPVKELVGKAL